MRAVSSKYVVCEGDYLELPDGTQYPPGTVYERVIYVGDELDDRFNTPIGEYVAGMDHYINGQMVDGPVKIVRKF